MNKLFPIIAVSILVLSSCEKKIDGPYLDFGSDPILFTPATNASFVLAEENAKNVLTPIIWSKTWFGYPAQVTYEVHLDAAGNNFREPAILGTVNQPTLNTVTVERLNAILLGRGFEPGKAASLELRVQAKVSNEVNILYSKASKITLTPYKASLNYPKLQVPGSHQGWNPADNNTVIYSLKSDDKYEGFLYFPANTEFKYTVGPKWDINYGDTGSDGVLDQNGDNLKAPDAGYYRLRVDLNDKSHSHTLTHWGLIGSATANGWDADQDMTYNASTGIWMITTSLKSGEIKFRANDAWGINFGDNGNNLSLEYDGANIPIGEAGNYEIQLILNTPLYTYQVTKK
ncbi:MAG TPA: SusE domain-containing protein [Saprospiraceae bacterium]|nr:SusE domain-containing protein [Saprospiraceae bacterium]